jgi:hypothetical protein
MFARIGVMMTLNRNTQGTLILWRKDTKWPQAQSKLIVNIFKQCCAWGLRNGSYVMSWDSGFAVDVPNKLVATDTTLSPKQIDPRHVVAARADEALANVYKQITRVDEEIARAQEQLSKREQDATRHPSDPPQTRMDRSRPVIRGNRPSLGGRVVRAFIGLTLAACIGVIAIAWQSPSYGNAARQIIARWAPQLAPTLSLTLENPGLPAQPSPPTIQAAAAKTAPPQPPTVAQTAPEGAASTAAASPELTPLLQSMARDLATVGQRVEQLKASQEQMARDNANLAEQLKAGREEMTRVIAMVSERPKIPEPLPRPTAAATRKPVSTLPSSRATAQPHAEKTQLSSTPRAPMPPR